MSSGGSRREFLHLLGASAVGALAGCSSRSPARQTISVTPVPVPSTTTDSSLSRESVFDFGSDQIGFDVDVLTPFTGASPARLEIRALNDGDKPIVALARSRFVLPFVDPDYAGTDQSGDPVMVLVPDDTRQIVDSEDEGPISLQVLLPDEPIDGCWSLPFDWPPAWHVRDAQLQTVSLTAGEARSHRYGLYFINECTAGSYTFENTFDLTVGRPEVEQELYRIKLGFDFTVTDDQDVLVEVPEPHITLPPSGLGRK